MKNKEEELKLILKVLVNQSRIYKRSYQETWVHHIHPIIKQSTSFEEVIGFAISTALKQNKVA